MERVERIPVDIDETDPGPQPAEDNVVPGVGVGDSCPAGDGTRKGPWHADAGGGVGPVHGAEIGQRIGGIRAGHLTRCRAR